MVVDAKNSKRIHRNSVSLLADSDRENVHSISYLVAKHKLFATCFDDFSASITIEMNEQV